MIIIPATASGSAKIIVKTRSPRAAAAEITWAQGRQAGDPALEAAVLRGPANGDRAIGGLRTAVPYPHHVASYISLCNQPSFRQPRNIRRYGASYCRPAWQSAPCPNEYSVRECNADAPRRNKGAPSYVRGRRLPRRRRDHRYAPATSHGSCNSQSLQTGWILSAVLTGGISPGLSIGGVAGACGCSTLKWFRLTRLGRARR
jgi:hypothetical protein